MIVSRASLAHCSIEEVLTTFHFFDPYGLTVKEKVRPLAKGVAFKEVESLMRAAAAVGSVLNVTCYIGFCTLKMESKKEMVLWCCFDSEAQVIGEHEAECQGGRCRESIFLAR